METELRLPQKSTHCMPCCITALLVSFFWSFVVTSSEKLCKFKRKTVLSGEQLTWEKTPLKKKIRSRLAFEKHVTRKVLQKFFYSSSKSETKVTMKWIFQDRGFSDRTQASFHSRVTPPLSPLFCHAKMAFSAAKKGQKYRESLERRWEKQNLSPEGDAMTLHFS